MQLTDTELRTVEEVFTELLKKPYKELNTFLGSLTIKEMQDLNHKLHYRHYCEKHNIKYEDLTEEDFVAAYEEEN